MKISITQKLLLFTFIILAFNVFIGYTVYNTNQKLREAEQWVQHTELVINKSKEILSFATDMETASRGFIITNDSTFLNPLFTAEKRAFTYIGELRQLFKENPSQLQRVDSLNLDMHKRLDFSLQSVELRSKKGLTAAIASISTNKGLHITDRIRQITNAIQQDEATLLIQRKQTNDLSVARFNRVTVVLFILLIMFTLLLLFAAYDILLKNKEKEMWAAELIIANKELAFQNEEKEKRSAELITANKELLAFTYVSSHDLQEPLRKIQTFCSIILDNENENLSENGKYNFERMQQAASRMQQLIDDLLAFSRINTTELIFEKTDLKIIIEEIVSDLKETIQDKDATVDVSGLGSANIIPFQFRQLMFNLISNALKFSKPDLPSQIVIKSSIANGSKINNKKLSKDKDYCHITVKDNGIGFESHFSERIFEVFQKLHSKEIYSGTGIGLAIVKKIVENHNGIIIATSELDKGATFDIYFPQKQ
jgi:signal transduction histidine kinase